MNADNTSKQRQNVGTVNGTAFIAARHGLYNMHGKLSSIGKEQMASIAYSIKSINVSNMPVAILCSAAPLAKESAEVIGKILGTRNEAIHHAECLWSDHDRKWDKKLSIDLVARELLKDGDRIVLCISHFDVTSELTREIKTLTDSCGDICDLSTGTPGFIVANRQVSLFD